MKKLLIIALLAVAAMNAHALDIPIGSYTMADDDERTYWVYFDPAEESQLVMMQVATRSGVKGELALRKNRRLRAFIRALERTYKKTCEWERIAQENNIVRFDKTMPDPHFPKFSINWTADNQYNLHRRSYILADNPPIFILLTDEDTPSTNGEPIVYISAPVHDTGNLQRTTDFKIVLTRSQLAHLIEVLKRFPKVKESNKAFYLFK